ncbi:hypothetical protein [Mycobacteroides abscessus]|uniref:hypothetical protein n=1 Tax=Mycobacteroides abscessus TaxID=36809 RepID=UPI00092C6AF0|nr:hypothetical protein [Mycobacteroides abscessus]SIC58911.1 Uncharacterised protein [Mycobacteroides abscessus subsp. abscessus]
MTNQQILEKAIQKAVDGGWYPRGIQFDCVTNDDPKGYAWTGTWEGYQQMEAKGYLPPDTHPVPRLVDVDPELFIFNHDFAKALWGDGRDKEGKVPIGDFRWYMGPYWQYHLQQMVIADDPIKHLGEHL